MKEDCSNEHPDFHVFQSLDDLVLLVVRIFDPSLVRLETLDGNDSFALIKELCSVRGVGQNPPQSTSKADCNKSQLQMC